MAGYNTWLRSNRVIDSGENKVKSRIEMSKLKLNRQSLRILSAPELSGILGGQQTMPKRSENTYQPPPPPDGGGEVAALDREACTK